MHQKCQSYDVWFLWYGAQQTDFFVILDNFLPFYHPTDPENQNFAKMNNTTENIVILKIHTINDSQMMYGLWDIEHERHNFLSFWTIFCPFLFNDPNNQNFEKLKKKTKTHTHTEGGSIILHTCIKNYDHMLYCFWDMTRERYNNFLFWTIFCPFNL